MDTEAMSDNLPEIKLTAHEDGNMSHPGIPKGSGQISYSHRWDSGSWACGVPECQTPVGRKGDWCEPHNAMMRIPPPAKASALRAVDSIISVLMDEAQRTGSIVVGTNLRPIAERIYQQAGRYVMEAVQSEMMVYLVVEEGDEGGYVVQRAYLDGAYAEAIVAGYNAINDYDSGEWSVEAVELDAPDVAYDAPIWWGTWKTRRKLKGEKQVVMVAVDGVTTVVTAIPSAVVEDSGPLSFAGPGWRELMKPVEYEEPAVWIDTFNYRQKWHTGDDPGPATVTTRDNDEVTVHGTSRDAVEELLKTTALQVKADRD